MKIKNIFKSYIIITFSGLLFLLYCHIETRWIKTKKIVIISDDDISFLTKGESRITAEPGTRISLLPVFGRVESVTATGLEYEVKNLTLELGVHSSVSNLSSDTEVTINASDLVLVVHKRSNLD